MTWAGEQVLVLGSGLSAAEWGRHLEPDHKVVCINHAWRLLPERLDVWIRPGDFPPAKAPPTRYPDQRWVGHDDYVVSMRRFHREIPGVVIGDLTFPRAVCWIMDQMEPRRIGFLGCDHVYDPEAVQRWMTAWQPGPQNRYVGYGDPAVPIDVRRARRSKSPLHQGSGADELDRWARDFFQGVAPSHFYGHGTPDPMRVGQASLLENFHSLLSIADALGIELENWSSEPESLLPFPRKGG